AGDGGAGQPRRQARQRRAAAQPRRPVRPAPQGGGRVVSLSAVFAPLLRALTGGRYPAPVGVPPSGGSSRPRARVDHQPPKGGTPAATFPPGNEWADLLVALR